MKIVRFAYQNELSWGVLAGDYVRKINGSITEEYTVTQETFLCKDVTLLAPCIPTKVVCVGLNYYDHAKEMGLEIPQEPLLFLKPPSAVTHPHFPIEYPKITQNLHYEAELAIVIKKNAKNVSAAEAEDYILGYTCANDVTARDIQKSDGQWTRAKSFDTFLPLGPCIETDINPEQLDIKLYLNGVIKQASNTRELIFKIPDLIAYISQAMTLHPGDVIITGTPPDVGPMFPGDVVAVEIAGIGRLENTVVKMST
jgi:2-keto-4-pentenoate hydratase/2-oxohepta-3-ene-1,7-dioic acid hydratase in catechol pathway